MSNQVEELADNRVRMTVEVPRADVHHAVEHAASDLAGNVKIPGFRQGKVPMPVLINRVGKERLYTEAIESHIGNWFWNAALGSKLHPAEQPSYDYELPSSDREDWRFTAEFAVQPKPELPDWKELEVPAADPEVPQDLIDQELAVLRSSVAELAPVDGRPAQLGDTVVVDLLNEGGESQRDYVVELGAGRVVEEIERELVGMEAGQTKEIAFELADEQTATVTAELKEIKEKILPELDDELARSASEFETLDELRADLHERLREQISVEADNAFRATVVDKLVEASKVDPEGPLVEARTRELLNGLASSLERRGIAIETYLQLTGTNPDDLIGRLRAEAKQSVARELVLEAVAEQVDLEISDAEVETLVREQTDGTDEDPDTTIAALRENGAFERLREDLRLRAALDRVASEVKRIPVELAEAREAIWTPDKEKPETETKLWTPASKET
jgi:trigger factor